MATRILKISELVELGPYFPVKQELAGRKVLLFARGSEPACKMVSDEAWSLPASYLQDTSNQSLAQELEVILDEGVWVVFPAAVSPAKEKLTASFGLGSFVMPDLPRGVHSAPSVPEPWMGTYGEKLPVIPVHLEEEEEQACSGLEWARRQRAHEGCRSAAPAKKQQATISSMFARAPMKVEPMDF